MCARHSLKRRTPAAGSRKRSYSAKPIYSSTLRRISSHSPSPIERMCAGGRQLHVGKRYFAQRHTTSSTVVWPAAQRSAANAHGAVGIRACACTGRRGGQRRATLRSPRAG